MNLKELSAACPGVDFTVPYKHSPFYSIGDYVLAFLQKTFDIFKSSPNIKNEVIVDFVKAGLVDADLPFTLVKKPSLCLQTRKLHLPRAVSLVRIQSSGLSALHKKKINHKDMKPANILLDSNLLPVICDFGLSKVFDKNSKSVKVQGTRAYLPPEQFDGKVGREGDIMMQLTNIM